MKRVVPALAAMLLAAYQPPSGGGECLVTDRVLASSDWNEGTEGWYLPNNTDGYYERRPGGYIVYVDRKGTDGPWLSAPPKFIRDLRGFKNLRLIWDERAYGDGGKDPFWFYIRLSGGGKSVVYNPDKNGPRVPTVWTERTFPLDILRQKVTEADWETIIGNLTKLEVRMDVNLATSDDSAIDNFRLMAEDPGISIEFDEVVEEGEKSLDYIPRPKDFYRECGLVFAADFDLYNGLILQSPPEMDFRVQGGYTVPYSLFLGPSPHQLSIEASFFVPGTRISGVTDFVSVRAFDRHGSTAGRIEAFDAGGELLAKLEKPVSSNTPSQLYEIRVPGIAKIRFTQDEDSGIFDNFFFHEPVPIAGSSQIPGDCNLDGWIDISDAVCILRTLFSPPPENFPCGDGRGDHPANLALLDWQCDGMLDLSDGIALIQYLFLEGDAHCLAVPGHETKACIPILDCPDGSACPQPPPPCSREIVMYVISSPSGGTCQWYRGVGDLDPLRLSLEARGFSVKILDRSLAKIDADLLMTANQIWIVEGECNVERDLDDTEIEALWNFYEDGGKVWLSLEGASWFEDTRPFLVDNLGLEIESDFVYGPAAPLLLPHPDHPLFEGVDQLNFDGELGPKFANILCGKVLWEYPSDPKIPGVILFEKCSGGKGSILIDTGWVLGYAFSVCGVQPRCQLAGSDDRRFAYNVADFFDCRR